MDAAIRRILPGLALGLALAPAAAAQSPAQGNGWGNWRGCWRLMSEAGTVTSGAAQPLVCITEVPGGARLTTTVADKPAVDQTIRSDGREQTVDEAGCSGTQRAEWSPDGTRLYSSASLTCSGDPSPRRVSGYALLLADGTWLDIQAVEVNARDAIRVRRYRHVDSATRPTPITGRGFALDDVKEATSRVSTSALEAAIMETGARLPLSGKALLDLDASGVPDRIIDLIVAVSYPDRFIVERTTRADRGPLAPQFSSDPFMYGMFGLPMWSAGMGYYDAYWNPYYYSPFAYSYYGRFDPNYVSGSTIYVSGGGGGSVDLNPRPQSTGRARAVDGRGYTQTRPRDVSAERAPSTTSTTSTASSAPPSDTSSSSSSSSSSSGGSVSSSGFSNGGGGSDSGRTAVPR